MHFSADKIDPFDLCRTRQTRHNKIDRILQLKMARKNSPGKKSSGKTHGLPQAIVRRSPRHSGKKTELSQSKNIQAAATVTQLTPVFDEAAGEPAATTVGITPGTTADDPSPADAGASSGTGTGLPEDQDPVISGTTAGDPSPVTTAGDPAPTGVPDDHDPVTPGTPAGNPSPADALATTGPGTGLCNTPGTTASVTSIGRYDDISPHVIIHVQIPTSKLLGTWRLGFSAHMLDTRLFFIEQEKNCDSAWFTIHRPRIKQYPRHGPMSISRTADRFDIPLWLTMQELSGLTRLHFPGLEEIALRCFLHFSDVSVPTINVNPGIFRDEHTGMAPLAFVYSLLRSPPQAMIDTDQANHNLETLADAVLPLGKKGATWDIIFRGALSMPQRQNRVWLVFSSSVKENEVLEKDAPFTKNVEKIRNFFKDKDNHEAMYKMGDAELTSFHRLCTLGESLSITCLSENGKADNVVAAIQFKRTEHGAWVNYFCTSNKTVTSGAFGSKPGFLPFGTPFRCMGLGFLLLRSLQLLLACNMQPPTLYMRVQHSSELFQYLLDRGFVEAPEPSEDVPQPHLTRLSQSYDLTSGNGFLHRDIGQPVVMVLTKLVSWTEKEHWRPPVLDTVRYHYTQANFFGLNHWPENVCVCGFPFKTDGRFIDQASRGLSFLGIPFFYHQDGSKLSGSNFKKSKLSHVRIGGEKLNEMDGVTFGSNTHWLNDLQVQFLINWIFRDAGNTVMSRFHAVPCVITHQLKLFFEHHVTVDIVFNTLHNYCIRNWKNLDCFMIFFPRQKSLDHWVLDIAINPFALIALVCGYEIPGQCSNSIYGWMHVDPMEQKARDGTIPKYNTLPVDSIHNMRDMLFLLNMMSRYRDMAIHGLLDAFDPKKKRLEDFMAMGLVGPFGRLTSPEEVEFPKAFKLAYPLSHFPQLKTEKKVLPIQTDSWNCGVFMIYIMMDMILSQHMSTWGISLLMKKGEQNATTVWHRLLKSRRPIVLPSSLNIGTAFMPDPTKAKGELYTRICQYIRMETVILMERLHCLYNEAFNAKDARTRWDIFGVPRPAYKQALKDDKDMEFVHRRYFTLGVWVYDMNEREMKEWMIPVTSLIHGPNAVPVFSKICYRNSEGVDELVPMLGHNYFLRNMLEEPLSEETSNALCELCKGVVTKMANTWQEHHNTFIQGSRESDAAWALVRARDSKKLAAKSKKVYKSGGTAEDPYTAESSPDQRKRPPRKQQDGDLKMAASPTQQRKSPRIKNSSLRMNKAIPKRKSQEQMPDGGSTDEEMEETSDDDSDASVVKEDQKKSPKLTKQKKSPKKTKKRSSPRRGAKKKLPIQDSDDEEGEEVDEEEPLRKVTKMKSSPSRGQGNQKEACD